MQESYAAICLISTRKVPRHGLDFRDTASLKSQWKIVPVGTIPSKQTPFFFLSDKCELTAGSDEKTQWIPPGIEPGSSDCRLDALTTELRSHDWNWVQFFVFHQTVSSFFLLDDPHVRAYKQVKTNENSLDF